MNIKQWWRKQSTPYVIAGFISLVLSAWISLQAGVINPDAICYLLSAQTIGTSGLPAAMKLCGQAQWPFYSVLIYTIAHTTHLSFAVSAYFLNSIFTLLSVIFFMLIVERLGANRNTIWLAAAVILLAHHFLDVRQYIIRDHGFWAAYLAAVYCLLVFYKHPTKRYALYFNISLLMATLFRIEGLVFLILAPFITWFIRDHTFKSRLRLFLMLITPIACIGLIAVIALWLKSQSEIVHISRLQYLYQQINQLHDFAISRYTAGKDMLTRYVLPLEAAADAGSIWLTVLMMSYLLNIFTNLTPVYAFLVLYAWIYQLPKQENPTMRNNNVVIYGFILINILITATFFAEYFFLSQRYLIALTLMLMTWVPFALNHLLSHWQEKRSRIIYICASILIIVYALTAIINFRDSKVYIYQAGNWLNQHVPNDKTIYSNDMQVMYYSNHFGNTIFQHLTDKFSWAELNNQQWKQADYVALRVNEHDAADAKPILDQIHTQPLATFSNKRGDKVYIYTLHS